MYIFAIVVTLCISLVIYFTRRCYKNPNLSALSGSELAAAQKAFIVALQATDSLPTNTLYTVLSKVKHRLFIAKHSGKDPHYIVSVMILGGDRCLQKLGEQYGFPRGLHIVWVPNVSMEFFGFYPKFGNYDVSKRKYGKMKELQVSENSQLKITLKASGFLSGMIPYRVGSSTFVVFVSKHSSTNNFSMYGGELWGQFLTSKLISYLLLRGGYLFGEGIHNADMTHGNSYQMDTVVVTCFGRSTKVRLGQKTYVKIKGKRSFVSFFTHRELLSLCHRFQLHTFSGWVINGKDAIKRFYDLFNQERDFLDIITLRGLLTTVSDEFPDSVVCKKGTITHEAVLGIILEGLVVQLDGLRQKMKCAQYVVRTMCIRELLKLKLTTGKKAFSKKAADLLSLPVELLQNVTSKANEWCTTPEGVNFFVGTVLRTLQIMSDPSLWDFYGKIAPHISIPDSILADSRFDPAKIIQTFKRKNMIINVTDSSSVFLHPTELNLNGLVTRIHTRGKPPKTGENFVFIFNIPRWFSKRDDNKNLSREERAYNGSARSAIGARNSPILGVYIGDVKRLFSDSPLDFDTIQERYSQLLEICKEQTAIYRSFVEAERKEKKHSKSKKSKGSKSKKSKGSRSKSKSNVISVTSFAPGAGKSTMVLLLCFILKRFGLHVKCVSNDQCTLQKKDFYAEIRKALLSGCDWVIIDKNLPQSTPYNRLKKHLSSLTDGTVYWFLFGWFNTDGTINKDEHFRVGCERIRQRGNANLNLLSYEGKEVVYKFLNRFYKPYENNFSKISSALPKEVQLKNILVQIGIPNVPDGDCRSAIDSANEKEKSLRIQPIPSANEEEKSLSTQPIPEPSRMPVSEVHGVPSSFLKNNKIHVSMKLGISFMDGSIVPFSDLDAADNKKDVSYLAYFTPEEKTRYHTTLKWYGTRTTVATVRSLVTEYKLPNTVVAKSAALAYVDSNITFVRVAYESSCPKLVELNTCSVHFTLLIKKSGPHRAFMSGRLLQKFEGLPPVSL